MTDQEFAIRKSFAHSELVMHVNGLLPGESFKSLYTFFAYALMIGFNILLPVLGYINLFKADPEERFTLLSNSFIYMELFILVFKNWSLIVTPDLTKKMLNRWNDDIFNTQVDEDKHIIDEAVRDHRIKYILYFILTASAPASLLLNIIFSAHDKLQLPIWLPMDIYNNTLRYTLVNVYIIIGYTHGVFGHFAIDFLLSSLMLYCASQLRLIKYKLENMEKYFEEDLLCISDEIFNDKLLQKKVYDKITQCAKVYDSIYSYVQELEEIYSGGVFSQFLVGSMVLSICLYNISKTQSLDLELIYALSFLLPMTYSLYLYCNQGTLVIEESLTIGDAIIKSPWYNYDMKSKRLLMILIERSKKPINFSAGKIVELSLETFVLIVKRSYSLLAVLRNY
ncbi:unnamed protein product [Phyllotreta striolata]|uniref:Odorant receptor n=1 Tax=Phyllotreta striolata TaxID=444603 RepID=A0A9N9TGK2_PHYSR|nr:unnamed protein product [Phyllotreta striolata]